MRLEPFGRVTMQYRRGSWHRPFAGNEGLGFGEGDGEITGELVGEVAWANYPRRREDGVWTPNLRGRVRTRQDQEVLISIHGQSVAEIAPGNRRAVTARIELTTEAEQFQWLNTCFLVGEGEIDEEKDEWWLSLYVCVNEEALGAPAIGAEPPARFRQTGRSAPNP